MFKSALFVLFGTLFAVIGPSTARAAIVEVGPGGFADIDTAIAAAPVNPGDVIIVRTNGGVPYPPFDASGLQDVVIVAGEQGAVTSPNGVGYSASIPAQVVIDGSLGVAVPCVTIDGASNVTIAGFYMVRCNGGIFETNSRHNQFFGNHVESADAAYLSVNNQSSSFFGNELIHIAGGVWGVLVENGVGNKISDNVIRRFSDNGIRVTGAADATTVLNNDVQYSGNQGIFVDGGVNATLVRNLVINNGSPQIELDGGSVEGEATVNNAAGGLIVAVGSNSASDND